MELSIIDISPLHERRMTIADYAPRPLPEVELPEFAFSRGTKTISRAFLCDNCHYPIHERPGQSKHIPMTNGETWCEDCADLVNWAYEGPMPPATLKNRISRDHPHKADPIWDTKFQTKFSKKPDVNEPLVTPRGAVKPMAKALSRVEEIRWMAETQHRELATTMAEMQANGIASFSLDRPIEDGDAGNIAEGAARTAPFAVCIGTETVEVPEHIRFLANMFGIEVGKTMDLPVYASQNYASNMARRIEWEKFRDACGPLHKVVFAHTASGELGIQYIGRDKDADRILALKRAMKARWLEMNGELPTIEQAVAAQENLPTHILDVMTPEQQDEFNISRLFGTEDPDPERVIHHADPDPKPMRDQYPFGDCRACDTEKKVSHRGCTILGWDLYYEDLGRWAARQDDRGYAGPTGILGLDDESSSSDIDIE